MRGGTKFRVSVLGPGLINALLAIAIVEIPIFARVVRSSVISVRELDFVMASKSLGASDLRILFTRILPNSLTPLIVQGTLGIASAILSAAALSFLGLGAEFPTPEWGLMLGEERNSVFNAPFLVFFPGFAIMLTVLSFNLIGDGLRDEFATVACFTWIRDKRVAGPHAAAVRGHATHTQRVHRRQFLTATGARFRANLGLTALNGIQFSQDVGLPIRPAFMR